MDPQVDPAAIPVADIEEDPDEAFTGPNGITDFFNDEYDEDYDEDDGEAYQINRDGYE